MQNATQKTNQRMPGRSAEVVGVELGNGTVGATPSAKPTGVLKQPVVQKPAIKPNTKPHNH